MAIMLSAPTVVKKSTVNRAFMTGKLLASATASASGEDVSRETSSFAVSRRASRRFRAFAPLGGADGSPGRVPQPVADLGDVRGHHACAPPRDRLQHALLRRQDPLGDVPEMTDPKHAPTRMKTMT